MSFCLLYATFSNQQEACKIAETLVNERLVACANIFPAHLSVYRWQGKIQQENEVAMILKSDDKHFQRICERITSMHSYDTCCVLQLPIVDGNAEFLQWLQDNI